MSFYSNPNFSFMNSFNSMEVLFLNDIILSMIIFILILTIFCFYFVFYFKSYNNVYILSNMNIELLWTIVPASFLICLAFPSLTLLYILEEGAMYTLVFKIISHQWYWSYENFSFSVDFVQYSDNNDLFRLLDTDSSVSMPMLSNILCLVTSEDVLHSWALPSMGVKMDAVPSRLNSLSLQSFQPSIFYGECSEICSLNHSKMPIKTEFMSWQKFLSIE